MLMQMFVSSTRATDWRYVVVVVGSNGWEDGELKMETRQENAKVKMFRFKISESIKDCRPGFAPP